MGLNIDEIYFKALLDCSLIAPAFALCHFACILHYLHLGGVQITYFGLTVVSLPRSYNKLSYALITFILRSMAILAAVATFEKVYICIYLVLFVAASTFSSFQILVFKPHPFAL